MRNTATGSPWCIYGAGGHAKDLLAQIFAEGGQGRVACLVDDFDADRTLFGRPVVSFEEARRRFPDSRWLIAVGNSRDRAGIAGRIVEAGKEFATFVSTFARVLSSHPIGPGAQIFAGSVLSGDVRVGQHVFINYNCAISHDVDLGDFATVSPGCLVAGRVKIGEGCFLGVGAKVVAGPPGGSLSIGARAVIGGGACVIGPVPADVVAVGVPAKIRPRNMRDA